ncbi:galactoside 2-alpha-L-fucosyltransferase 3-like [Octopus vulgaris]|uniref:L-Fucosyltransferase n=1 Tax=Octopus vulgaris TaxID=6645 RepID=A0AA36BM36_OCTVU|nr:galactoside 2-alpha-L-fucosyltransferase 3-like [Octopus vulgaris]
MLVNFHWRKFIALSVAVFFVYGGFQYLARGKKQRPDGISISVRFSGRFGNHLFQYASLLGIARKNNMTACVPSWLDITSVFNIDTCDGDVSDFGAYVSYNEEMFAKFFPRFFKLPKQNTLLNGYLQSFKYFDFMKSEILQNQYRFKEKYQSMANSFLQTLVTAHRKKQASTKQSPAGPLIKNGNADDDPVVVGIHVRRGDFVRGYTRGYSTPPLPYYYRAMNYFLRKYPKIIFVICSNDIEWCQDNLADENIYFSATKNVYVDFAILASCDHIILSSGTFSWWAGYLNKGIVVYYKDFPRPNSILEKSFNRKDYYPDSWIPL